MTNDEAIARIEEHIVIHKTKEPRAIHITEALEKVIETLKQEPCADCISRQAVIDEAFEVNTKEYGKIEVVGVDAINALPPVNLQPKIGHWMDTGSGQMCSSCGEIQQGYDSFRRFCASCGAKMQEVEVGNK